MAVNGTQKVCNQCIERMDKMGLYNGRKATFDKAIHSILSFCEKNKKEFEKWMKQIKNQPLKNQ